MPNRKFMDEKCNFADHRSFHLVIKIKHGNGQTRAFDFLKLFIGDQFLSEIVTETNIYALLTKMSMSYVTKVSISSVTNVSMSSVTIVSMSSVTSIPVFCDYKCPFLL